jgi:hypothetical protein
MNLTCWWKWKSKQKRPAGQAPFRAMVCSEQQDAFRTFGIQIKNILFILFMLSFLGFHLNGCTTKYGTREPDQKQALRTLAGGVAGILLAGNTGGAIVGALVVDVISVTTIKYEDKQLGNGDQAAKRYKDQDKKVEDKKDQEKKAEKKEREQKRVSLFIEESSVATLNITTGSTVKAHLQYTLLAPVETEQVRLTETRTLWTAHSIRELDTREVTRSQGTYRSSIQFKMPEDMPRGYCILYTTVSDGKRAKTAQTVMNIL